MTDQTVVNTNEITIYSTSWCSWCDRAKALLASRGVGYQDVNIEEWADPRGKLEELTGRRSVPQIIVGATHVGGFDDLVALDADGALQELFTAEGIAVNA